MNKKESIAAIKSLIVAILVTLFFGWLAVTLANASRTIEMILELILLLTLVLIAILIIEDDDAIKKRWYLFVIGGMAGIGIKTEAFGIFIEHIEKIWNWLWNSQSSVTYIAQGMMLSVAIGGLIFFVYRMVIKKKGDKK